MTRYDLAIAWNWEFDDDFVHGVELECARRNVSTFQVRPDNLPTVLAELQRGDLAFRTLYDRASDADTEFLNLVRYFQQHALRVINPQEAVEHAIDKATMHLELITQGINVPRTVLIPPLRLQKEFIFTDRDIEWLGVPFVVKPANTTGGGTGVVLNARTAADVEAARQEHPNDKYLVQEFIHPKTYEAKRAWFRAYSVFDEDFLCWWDDQTHEYSGMSGEEEGALDLHGLRHVIREIKKICRLDFFSSEIARIDDGRYIVVDYVNEICDMRLKSKFPNGAPDSLVRHIEQRIAAQVQSWTQNPDAPD